MTGEIPYAVLRREVEAVLRRAVGDDYVCRVLDSETGDGKTIFDDIMEDIELSSGWNDDGCYNEDDIRLSIGRVLLDAYS